jgi:hypothetical protein
MFQQLAPCIPLYPLVHLVPVCSSGMTGQLWHVMTKCNSTQLSNVTQGDQIKSDMKFVAATELPKTSCVQHPARHQSAPTGGFSLALSSSTSEMATTCNYYLPLALKL